MKTNDKRWPFGTAVLYESMADLNFLIPVDPSASQLDNDSVANDRRKGKPKQKIN